MFIIIIIVHHHRYLLSYFFERYELYSYLSAALMMVYDGVGDGFYVVS
jgi:hypothetical protein